MTLAMVMSVDGKITKWGSPTIHSWTSKEDQTHFEALIETHKAIVMGRKTFDAARGTIRMPNEKLRIVLTRSPERHQHDAVPGMLEFSDAPPAQILANLESRGHDSVLLAGGAEANAAFFAADCVDELWLTIEPRLFGTGNELIATGELDVELTLRSVEEMNAAGTILLKYVVASHGEPLGYMPPRKASPRS